jgi:hypothetical protein
MGAGAACRRGGRGIERAAHRRAFGADTLTGTEDVYQPFVRFGVEGLRAKIETEGIAICRTSPSSSSAIVAIVPEGAICLIRRCRCPRSEKPRPEG